jgi:hypothetical protein
MKITVELLQKEASAFARTESRHAEPPVEFPERHALGEFEKGSELYEKCDPR